MAKIAWIEDDYERIGALVKLLENDGHFILRYKSLEEVQKNLDAICACDAIILDIILPPVDNNHYLGLSLLEQLRHQQGYKGPVTVCSRVQNPEVIRRLRELGAEILHKPVRPSELYRIVSEALEND